MYEDEPTYPEEWEDVRAWTKWLAIFATAGAAVFAGAGILAPELMPDNTESVAAGSLGGLALVAAGVSFVADKAVKRFPETPGQQG